MNLESRLKSLENRVSRLENMLSSGGLCVFDSDGNEVEAEIIQEPREGKAGLAVVNGKTLPIELQEQNPVIIIEYDKDQADEKLYMRKRSATVYRIITSIPRPSDNAGS